MAVVPLRKAKSVTPVTLSGFPSQLYLHYKLVKHYEAEHHWQLSLSLRASEEKGDDSLAYCVSLIILKNRLKGQWFEELDIHSQETAEFSQLFDNNGRLQDDLITHDIRKGSAVWGHELDKGGLIYIEALNVDAEHRRKGLATFMLQQTLNMPVVASHCSFAYVWPSPSGRARDETSEQWTQKRDLAVKLFRLGGFRRVGKTTFFAHSLADTAHASRSLAIDNDADAFPEDDPARTPAPIANNAADMFSFLNNNRQTAQFAAYPLHAAAFDPTTTEEAALTVLAQQVALDPNNVNKADQSGATPLHLAAVGGKYLVVVQLLQLGASISAVTRTGETPLESLEASLKSDRNFSTTFGVPWKGATDAQARILYALKHAAGQIATGDTATIERLKYGCTCGSCLGNWLSPRMKHRMLGMFAHLWHRAGLISCTKVASEVAGDGLEDEANQMESRVPQEVDDYIIHGDHVPRAIRQQGIFKSYLKGYACMHFAIASLLNADQLPTPNAILRVAVETRRDYGGLSYYLNKGGRAEHALGAVIYEAWSSCPGRDDWLFEEAHGPDHYQLPECADDFDFMLVRQKLGLDQEYWQPDSLQENRNMYAKDADMESDEEDEDEDEDEEMGMGSDDEDQFDSDED